MYYNIYRIVLKSILHNSYIMYKVNTIYIDIYICGLLLGDNLIYNLGHFRNKPGILVLRNQIMLHSQIII